MRALRYLFVCFALIQVAFSQPSKALIQGMQDMRALTVRMYEEDLIKDFTGAEDCKDYYFYRDAMERHASLFFSLALDFMDQIPLLKNLQPKTPQDKEFVKILKVYESFQLFALLRSYIPDIDCYTYVSPPDAFDATQVTQAFLDGFNLFFAPVFQAQKEGVSLWDTLVSQTTKVGECDYDVCNTYQKIQDSLDSMSERQKNDPAIKSFLRTFKQLDLLSSGFENDAFDSYEQESYYKFIKAFLGVDLQQNPAILLDAYYDSRLKVLLQDIYTHLH